MSDAAQIFNEAYQLIEQGDLASARQLLDDVRAENENNPDFWWLYAHAVDDEATGRDALNRVRQLNPDYPGLDNLLPQPDTASRPIRPLRPPTTLPDLPRKTPAFDDDFGGFDDDFEVYEKPVANSRRNLYLAAAGIVVAVIVIAALLLFMLPRGDETTSTPTAILVLPTTEVPVEASAVSIDVTEDIIDMTEEIEPTAEDVEPTDDATEAEPTQEDTTPTEEAVEPTNEETQPVDVTEAVEPTDAEIVTTEATEAVEPTEETTSVDATEAVAGDADYSALAPQISQFNVPDEGVEVAETMLGNTLLITTCSPPGPTATQSILGILTVLQDEPIGAEIEAIGFRVANCTDDTTIRIIGVSREQFDDYVNANISAQQLQSSMRPIG
jgi:hypothetical protein